MDNLGQKLKLARISKGLTMNALAKQAGISCSVVSLIEKHDKAMNINTIYKICKVLGVSIDSLVGLKPETKLEQYEDLFKSLIRFSEKMDFTPIESNYGHIKFKADDAIVAFGRKFISLKSFADDHNLKHSDFKNMMYEWIENGK
jgi:transcriptional regulator with XRE-family HTH domain